MSSTINSYNVCFLGRTGNGKTSLVNALWNTHFPTDPLLPCTKELYCTTILLPDNSEYEGISIYDTPGIGEFSSNSKYERYYQHAISLADCIVLVTTFDRTDAPAQRLLKSLKPFFKQDSTVRFVVALSHIDSTIITDANANYIPWDDERNVPTEMCLANIKEREVLIHARFDNKFLPFNVIPVCPVRQYGLEALKDEIINNLN